ncbi:MAG: amino acid permease [Candidatus Protochlamydia sp.]|nr:amino acid permease [Candidatus Protochlamydia sp.]
MEDRKMGLSSIILLGINATIGSGIFLLPGKIAELSGNSFLIIYGFVTLLVLAIAWCFSQCAALFNRNGGAYLYAKEAFGDFIGFEIGLMRWVVGMIAWGTLTVGLITAVGSFWPEAARDPLRSLLIVGFVGGLGIFNLAGIQFLKYINNIVTIAKMLPLLCVVAAGSYYTQTTNFGKFEFTQWECPTFGSAALIMFYAFGGFETLVVAAGEMRKPEKNLPLALFAVIFICSFLYFLIQMMAIGVLGTSVIGSENPIIDGAATLFGNSGKWLITIGMLISMGGVNLCASFVTPRSAAALAHDGLVPHWMAVKNQADAPIGAIMATVGITIIIALSGNFTQLAAISVVSRFAQYGSTCLATPILYQKQWKNITKLRRCLLVCIPILGVGGLTGLLFEATESQLYWGLGGLLPGIPLYFLQKYSKKTALS